MERQNKRFGRRIAALGSGSEGKEGVKRVSRRQRGAQGLAQPHMTPNDASPCIHRTYTNLMYALLMEELSLCLSSQKIEL